MSDVDAVGKIRGSVSDGGWSMEGLVFNDADKLLYNQEITLTFDMYGSGAWQGDIRTGFSGHLTPEPFIKTYQSSEAPFSAFTAHEWMKQGEVQGIFFKDVTTPSNQHQINSMTFADIVEHLVGKSGEYGHCNLSASIWDGPLTFNIDKANSSNIDEYEIKQGNFWARLEEISEIDFYFMYIDKGNQFNYVPHPMFLTPAPSPTLDIDNGLLMEPLSIERRNINIVGQVKLTGYQPDGTQLSATYPTAPSGGVVIAKGGYLASGSGNMSQIAEHMFRWERREYTVEAEIGGALGLRLELLDRVTISYSSNSDGIAWNAKPFWVHEIEVEFGENWTAVTRLKLEEEN